MGKPNHYPKPDLSHLSSRPIQLISTNRQKLEWDIHQWMTEVVKRTKQPPENGFRPETILMATAQDSIDVLMQAPPSMALRGSGKQIVHAQFRWGRFPNGHWYVSAVSLGLNVSAAEMQLARQRALKERLLEKAELENSKHIHLRQIVFPAESHLDTWTNEITMGDRLIKSAIERAHEHAREDAKTLENPVTPVDMALDMTGMGVGHLAKAGEGAEHLAGYYEALAHGREARELGEKLREKEKSTGDKVLETGLALAGQIPGAGPFVNTIAGMMFDIAISSDASRVTKLRSRCYVYFVAGYINKLTLADTGVPGRKLDKKYFDLGAAAAPTPNSARSFNAQISLMHYASEHYTDGGWAGLGFKPQVWTFPDQYVAKWSPELLGRAMATQLHKREYLIE